MSNANDAKIPKLGLVSLPYELFTLKHNPDAVKSAQSLGIVSYHYDSSIKDMKALKDFLDSNA